MDHVAIMKPEWRLIEKILKGEKTIESRWYSVKAKPWNEITKGDVVYFKDSGRPVTARAIVSDVMRIEELNHTRIQSILTEFGERIGAPSIPSFYDLVKKKRYCLLVFLKNAEAVQPFAIDKRGFGAMAAWISVPNIETIKL